MLFGSTLALPSLLPPAKIETNFLTGWVQRVMFVTVPCFHSCLENVTNCVLLEPEREKKKKKEKKKKNITGTYGGMVTIT